MSIITSNVCQINLRKDNIKKTLVFPDFKNNFGSLIYILSWKHLFEIYFRLLRRNNKLKIINFLTNIWRNNWRFNIWCHKRTPLMSIPVNIWVVSSNEFTLCQEDIYSTASLYFEQSLNQMESTICRGWFLVYTLLDLWSIVRIVSHI